MHSDRRYAQISLAALIVTGAAAALVAALGGDRFAIAATVLAGLWLLGFWMWWTWPERSKSWGDLGRGVMIGVITAIALGLVQRELNAKLDAREKRQTFELSITGRNDLSAIDLSGRELSNFYLAGKNLTDADLRGTDLSDANLRRANLERADLRGADLSGADLRRGNLNRANLSGANLEGADLTVAQLEEATLHRTRLARAKLDGVKLRDACLTGAGLRFARMEGADLTRAVLTGADLRGARLEFDLRNARLDQSGLARVRHDRSTKWPIDFRLGDELLPRPERERRPPGLTADAVERVVDGDTLLLRGRGAVRLIGINTPGLERYGGHDARRFAERLLPRGTSVGFALGSVPRDPFDRSLVYLWLRDGRSVNAMMLETGFAERSEDSSNSAMAGELRAAETRAKQSGTGLWARCPER